MTHNILAQFSCSLNSDGTFKDYPVVSGSIFNEEYNETLDSATILLSQVKKEDRLSYIKPYDFVRVYDTSTYNEATDTYGFDKIYLVDNFVEKENNIEEHIFGYTINLMSETKLLEKIQCPNLTITHDVNEDGTTTKKTIYQYIKQYMDLFVPKIKYADVGSGSNSNWNYEPLIKLPANYTNATLNMTFNMSDFRGNNITLISDRIDGNIDASSVEILNYSIVSVPTLDWSPSSIDIHFNETLNSIVFQGSVSNFTMHEYTTPNVRFYENDFTFYSEIPGMGNEYEISVVVATLGSDVLVTDASSVQIINVSVDAPLLWSTQEATFNPNTRQIIFHGVCLGKADGEVVVDYMCKKVDGTVNINYRYIDFNNNELYRKFNVPCADLAFSSPTLRQLLTMLMQQVGCIPTVKNRTLGYLDFQKDLVQFGRNGDYTVGHTVNRITRGLSSDSFVNTLINTSNQVLDSNNEVTCETLGFRDEGNLLLKQKENLFLETSLPIYKVNKCILRFPGQYTGYISSSYGCIQYAGGTADFPVIYYAYNKVANNTATVKFFVEDYEFNVKSSYYNVSIKDNLIYFLGRRDNGSYYIISSSNFDNFTLNRSNTTEEDFDLDDAYITSSTKTFYFNNLPNNVVGFFFSGMFYDDHSGVKQFSFIKFDDNDPYVKCYGWEHETPIEDSTQAVFAGYNMQFAGYCKWNISKLVVENSIRNLLDRDFTRMASEMPHNNTTTWKIETLAKYIYGTVGYSIGSNRIQGFSDVFNVGSSTWLGWVRKDYTYIENIINFLKYNYETDETTSLLYDFFEFLRYLPLTFGTFATGSGPYSYFCDAMGHSLIVNLSFQYYSPTNNNFSDTPFFSSCIFDLYYQPLNSFNLAYTKSIEEVDYPLQQYNSNASGLADFDRLSLNEQEQVDRIGNETLSISQRTTNFEDIQTFENGPLYFMDDTNRSGTIDGQDNGIKYVIFKHSFSINNNCFNASYVGSKDAILKDYFTSIRTKYRAYQYVDYNASTLRKERDTFFVRIASNYFNGDDRVWLGNYNVKKPSNLNYWIYDTTNMTDKNNSISYECEYDVGIINTSYLTTSIKEREYQAIKNSLSVIATKNTLGLIYEYIDNIGAGPYLNRITNDSNLGGVPQTWQIWSNDYNAMHTVSFVNYIDFYSKGLTVSGDADVIKSEISKIEKNPIVDTSYIDLFNSPNVIFNVVDDNSKEVGNYANVQRTFYKDNAERINHTIQFIYYSLNNDVLFGEDFISGTPIVGRFDNCFNSIYGSSIFNIDSNEHIVPTGDTELIGVSSYDLIINEMDESIKLVDSSASSTALWIYEHIFEKDLSELDDYSSILFNIGNYTVTTTTRYTNFSIELIKSEKKIRCKLRTNYSNYGLFTITVPYFYNDFVFNTVDDNNIPVLRVMWGTNNIIKMCSKKENGKVVDIAVFKKTSANTKYMDVEINPLNPIQPFPDVPAPVRRSIQHSLVNIGGGGNNSTITIQVPYTDFYFTINDTKTDYVLSEKNGILYRRYKVATNTMNRDVEPIYEED